MSGCIKEATTVYSNPECVVVRQQLFPPCLEFEQETTELERCRIACQKVCKQGWDDIKVNWPFATCMNHIILKHLHYFVALQ